MISVGALSRRLLHCVCVYRRCCSSRAAPKRCGGGADARARPFACFATLYAFVFIAAAEYLFWGEFFARFNFISVDYLVYRRESPTTSQSRIRLRRSLTVLLIVTAALYWRLLSAHRGRIARLPADGIALARRPRVAAIAGRRVLWHRAGTARPVSDNYVRELASDQVLINSSPRSASNELDYAQFYQSVDATRAMRVLKR
jgi:hypothetical protein